jgi:exodeoxyribonuclease VII small subunit
VTDDRALTFEEAMKRLAEIVASLESGELDLEQSLALFEEGVRLSRAAEERLRSAQQRVEQLVGFDAQGRPKTAELEEAQEGAASKPGRR